MFILVWCTTWCPCASSASPASPRVFGVGVVRIAAVATATRVAAEPSGGTLGDRVPAAAAAVAAGVGTRGDARPTLLAT